MILRQRRLNERSGFTLMELMVVVAILVVLAGAAVPIYMKFLDDAKKSRARVDVTNLTKVVEAYYFQHGEYPASLEILTQATEDGGKPSLEVSSLLDPWNHPYEYQPNGQHNAATGKPDIWSNGVNPGNPNSIIGNWSALQGAGGM